MNEPQKRRVAATFQHVDELLRTALLALTVDGSESPFNDLFPDALPEQCQIVAEGVRLLRERMTFALRRLDIPLQPPAIPATRSAFTHLMFAEVDMEDIDPVRLKGYGHLAAEDAQILGEICTELGAILRRMRGSLEGSLDQDWRSPFAGDEP